MGNLENKDRSDMHPHHLQFPEDAYAIIYRMDTVRMHFAEDKHMGIGTLGHAKHASPAKCCGRSCWRS